MTANEVRCAIEAILFVSGEPVRSEDLYQAFSEEPKELVDAQLQELSRRYQEVETGFYLEQTAGGWRLATRPEFDPFLRKYFSKAGEGRLSMAALETMSIIAYRQPITAPEISEIRGVNSSGVIRTLLERRMIRIAGRKNVVGSPFLYRTTKEFLVHFGLNSIQDLPRLEEFAEILGENVNEDLVDEAAPMESAAAIEGGDDATDVSTASEEQIDSVDEVSEPDDSDSQYDSEVSSDESHSTESSVEDDESGVEAAGEGEADTTVSE